MASEEQFVTPADWAGIAGEGQWQIMPHLDLINRKLVATAVARNAGTSRNTLIMCPPQHGKTTIVSHAYPGWWLGMFPRDNVGLIGYEADFAAKRGRAARDIFAAKAPAVFGVEQDPEVAAAAHWAVKGHGGTMSTFGAGGGITGSPMNLLLLDDPIKNEAEAYSETFRENQWEWFTGTVMSRVRAITSVAMIYTAWHEDDLGQRIIRGAVDGSLEPWDILRIPALAETQEDRDDYAERMGLPLGQPDPLNRPPGECLWPAMWPVEKLLMRRKTNAYQFEAMFQGRPRPKGGSIFKGEWFKRCGPDAIPADAERVRFWDKAATDAGGDYTVSVLMARTRDGRYFVENVTRDRLSPFPRDEKILAVAAADRDRYGHVRIGADQDPAAAGKTDAGHFRRMLAAYEVHTAPIAKDKVLNARAFAAAVEGGFVHLVEAPWNRAYIDELESFDKGRFKDQVDASSGAYNTLSAGDATLRIAPDPFGAYRGRRAALSA